MLDDGTQFGRRELLQRLAMSAGGLLTFPLVAASHPIQDRFRDGAALEIAEAKAGVREYDPEFLEARQFEQLRILAERIVPGSTQARSSEFIDQLLTVSSAGEQRTFVQALNGFEALAVARAGARWTALSEQQQNDVLTFASNEKAGVAARGWFEHLKGWIVGAYYSSEQGMRELGWTGRVFFPALPGCEHAEHD